MPRKDRQRLTVSDKNCVFCGSAEDDEVKYGKIYRHNGIITHYYCLLLSSNMQQKGSDEEGILGFLKMDILDELRRGKRLTCSYCKRNGATLGCCNTKCKKIFHLPCGLKSGSLHQFFGEFRSYCSNHRPKQKIDDIISAQIQDPLLCYICYDNVERNNLCETLWAPCCKKNAWFHRCCVQQLAMSAGYFFKCPLCNNKKEFQKAMLDNGIFIPCQDASWELVPNAFQELLYRHNRCDAGRCICSKGRRYTSSNPKWELILCRTCGSQGIHVACGRLKWGNATWDCRECTSILIKTVQGISEETRTSSNSTPSVDASAKDNGNADSDGSDSDISVGVEEPIYGPTPWPTIPDSPPQASIRPGPRSFKLKQQKMLRELCDINSDGASSCESSPCPESSRGKLVENYQGPGIPDSSTSSKVDETRQRAYPLPMQNSKPLARTSTNAPEELVIVDSDEEIIPEKLSTAKINENVLTTNNGLTIPVHHLPTPIPNGLKIVNDVKLPMMRKNLPIVEPAVFKTVIVNHQSPGHIAVGSSHNPMIIGNIQKPPEPRPTSSATSHPQSTSLPRDSTSSSALPIHHNVIQAPEYPAMAIKITNVTSLPPEMFAAEPQMDTARVSTEISPEVVDIESENEEINYQLAMAQQPKRTNSDGNQGIQVNREKRPAPVTPDPPSHSTSEAISADSKRVRTDNPTGTHQAAAVEPPMSLDKPYVRGVSLDNAAIVNVMGKEFIVPLPDEPRVRVSSTWVPAYDGDAGTSPADETTETITRCPSDRAGTMEIHGKPPGPVDFRQPISTSADSISESNNPSIDTRPYITTTADNSNRLNIGQVSLKDLKFRITGDNTVKMSITNIFTMKLHLDTRQNNKPGSKCEAGPEKSNGSSLVRRSSSTTHENRIKTDTNLMKSPTRESSSATNISKFTKSPERRKVNDIKENLAPFGAEKKTLCYCRSPERKVKRFRLDSDDSIHYETWQKHIKRFSNLLKGQSHPGTSRDGLKELSHSLINQRSESHSRHSLKKPSQINPQGSCNISEEKECLPISIELSRIGPLLLSRPALFDDDRESLPRRLVKFNSLSDLRCYSSGESHIGTLRRSKSLNNLLSSSISEFFDMNVNDNRINSPRRGKKRKTCAFEERFREIVSKALKKSI